MPIFQPSDDQHKTVLIDGVPETVLVKDAYDAFNSALLGLGPIDVEATSTDVIAAVFDLEGFTNFSKQIEPHLSVPLFLSQFLEWLFLKIKSEMTVSEQADGYELFGPLPFFVKFMGDGLLVLWDVSKSNDISRRNIVVSCSVICDSYVSDFYASIRKMVVSPPPRVRCGLARGTAFSVGNGNDYVGSCINMASRLQKLPGLTFSFNRRGFNLESEDVAAFFKDQIVVKKVSIRGIGDDELVAILSEEYEGLSDTDKLNYSEP